MATITTTTSSGAFSFPPQTCMDRAPDTGHLWAVCRTATTTIAVFRSIDDGGSWTSQGSFTRTGLIDIGEARIDQAGDHIHLVFLTNQSGEDRLYYRRIDIRTGSASFSSGELFLVAGNASNNHDFLFSASVAPYKNPDGSFAIIAGVAFRGSSHSGVEFFGVSIRNDAPLTTYRNDGIIKTTREYARSGDDSGGVSISLDFEHNGDGFTAATPNVWATFQIHSTAYCVKFAWQGYKNGWKSPSSAPTVAGSRSTVRDLPSRWDGERLLIVSRSPSDTTKINIYERDVSNTTNTATRTSPTHPQGVVNATMIGYNHVTKDFRLFAVGTSTAVLYYVDFTRATATWGSWTQANATAPVTSEWGIRRSTYGTYQYDLYHQTGGGSPWTLSNYGLPVNFPPTAPTWVTGTAGTPVTNGAAFDVSVSLTLDWIFNDPGVDTQSAYAVSRQIGAGSIEYWRASDSTWQASEVQNTSATTGLVLTTGQWVGGGGAADAAHKYRVKTWDSGGSASTYSDTLSIVPSTRVDPTLTAPTASQVLNTGLVTATWTVSEQGSYRVTVTNVATGVVVHDTGFLTDPTPATPSILSYVVPVTLVDGFSGSLTLQTRNAEGLASVLRTVAFSIDFVEPVAPVVSILANNPAEGGNDVQLTQGAPTGAQPATVRMDLYRRVAGAYVPANANPYFETNASDWSNVNYSTAARSTVQAHQGTASLLCTPSGAQASPYVQTTTIYTTNGPGNRWSALGWSRSTTANKPVRLKLQWYDASNALLSETTRDFTTVAGVWLWMMVTGTAPDLAVGVRIAAGQINTPAAGDTVYFDELKLLSANDDEGLRIETNVASGEVFLDWRAVGGVNYEYRGYAEAANATAIYGPWLV